MDRQSVERPGARRRVRTFGIGAAVVWIGLASPTPAQSSASGDNSFVGLPPSPTVIGTPTRLPDGSIAVVPANVPPAPTMPTLAPAQAVKRPVENAPARRATAAAVATKPAVSRAARTTQNIPVTAADAPSGATIVSQIHNAPGWRHSHTYTYEAGPYTRVVNGPGWSETNGSYDPGRTLDAYQLTSTGSCTSAASGGPTGIGASIKDGTCTWKYLSTVDYISITGWAFDNRPWKRGTAYMYGDYVVSGSPLRAYEQSNAAGCTSTVAPTGTASGSDTTFTMSNGCLWKYWADILYSSEKSYIPTQTHTTSKSGAMLHMQANYEAQLWNDREYVAGQNGEVAPIRTQSHMDNEREGSAPFIGSCPDTARCYHVIITTAPGESFADSLKPSEALTGYDPSKGVAIRDSLPYKFPYEPAGFDVHDNYTDLIGLQIKSIHGAAVNGMSSFGNAMTIRDCILDGGNDDQWTSHAAVTTDTSSVVANSLIISHAPIGVVFKYPGFLLHSTVVSPDHVANSVGVETFNRWVYNDTTVSNTAIFGFTHAVAHDEVNTSWSPQSSNNVTDAPVGDSGKGPWPYGGSAASSVDVLPGTKYGASMVSAFVKPGRDWRPKVGSPLVGTGNAFGTFEVGCQQLTRNPSCAQLVKYNFDSPDIVDTARPQAGRYDIGAWQSPAIMRRPQNGRRSRAGH